MNILRITLLLLAIAAQANGQLIVHEWGTFTSLVDSNGRPQNGMYNDDEVLPDFVHNFGDANWPKGILTSLFLNQNMNSHRKQCPGNPKIPCDFLLGQKITQKMETPIVYFYADEPQQIQFDVSFPNGIISQSYPMPQTTRPYALPGVKLKNGFASYRIDVLQNTNQQPPPVTADNIYSHARKTQSNLIQLGNEVEKFIFYRGLGEFRTELHITSRKGHLQLQNQGKQNIPAAFLIYTDGATRGDFISLNTISLNQSIHISAERIEKLKLTTKNQNQFLAEAKAQLLAHLKYQGLFHDEAEAMINTWEHGYFQTPGLRVLYVLNAHEVEAILPAKITPNPNEFHRAFVGRLEILLDTDEEIFLREILRDGKKFDTKKLGRMAHPILLRIKELASEKKLLTDDISEILDHLISQDL